ncbi:caspase family protein [Bradyrhizobium sp. LHD-71]|uniref:caspase family protein n=1 Tax=Bradyrhizobium sp. LHD-71 TaxID=3072141 RepID=UPI00280E9D43|nr:caspase family protein [Bradyrhizobium sp. LHD-71]MDQ8727121.1 caspase family protein [Bradyrhizobium sp. LHD-71]
MRMRLVMFFCLILSLVMVNRSAAADARFALVIGNAKYPDSESPLKEPINDMRAMADELKRAGFEVAVGENLSGEAMRRAINALYEKIKPGAVAMIFFSGYGIQSGRQSFMIPVDSAIWDEKDVRRDGISLDSVLSEMNSRGASVKIAILDASRRNPFERRFRQFSTGLAPVTAPRGTLVMYSAPPGTVVSDSATDRSAFVTELLKEIRVPNLTAEEAFHRTRVGVSRVSKEDQIPWFSSSLAEEFSFGPRTQATLDPKPPSPEPKLIPSEPRVQAPEPKLTPPEPRVTALPAPAPNAAPAPPQGAAAPAPPPTPSPAPQQSEAEKRLAAINADPAMQELTKLIAANANDQAAFYKRGQLYAVKGAYLQAMKDFDDAIRLDPRDVEALNNRCWVKTILGELQAALKDCNDALKLRPNFVDALDSRGLANLKIGQNSNAISDFDAALKISPKLASSLYGRGLARQRSGDAAAGERDVAAARAIDPNIASEFAGYGIR